MAAVLPSAAWPEVRALFFAAREASADERARLLADPAVDAAVRAYVARLLAAAADGGGAAARFETPALVALHGGAAGDDGGGGAPTWPEAPSLVGRQLGPYRVVRRVGQGGMGAVYEARRIDGAYDGRVAVKTLWRGADSAVLARRFRSERQILASLAHPGIARLLDGGATAEGTPYLVMEYVDGVPIDAYCDERRLGLAARLDLFRQVCAAVAHAHRHLVVHRDLKPGNVFVTADGAVKLLDFGVAKLLAEGEPADDTSDPGRARGRGEPGTLTGAGLAPFTTAYAAPEQLAGGRVSTAADVYALGALLTVLLAGRPPFAVEGLGAAEAVWARGRTGPAAPSALALAAGALRPPGGTTVAAARGFSTAAQHARALRGELDAVAGMALRDDPARRYATADALADDVRRYLRRDRVLARPDTVGYRVRTFARRQRALVAGVGVAALALVAGSGVALREAWVARQEAARAERVAGFLERVLGTGDVGASDADPDGATLRIGPRATVAAALDSARARVPAVFARDPRVRARLYTAIGGSYVAQDRGREAELVLDSAVRLARASYGPRSAAFVAASLAAGLAAVRTNAFARAERHFDAADAALRAGAGAGGVTGVVTDAVPDAGDAADARRGALGAARALLALAQGQMARADSLAAWTVAAEERRTRAPTAARAWALRVRGTTAGDGAGARFRQAIAVMDSLGAPMAVERLDALAGLGSVLALGGRVAEGDAVLAEGARLAAAGYGPASRAALTFHTYRAMAARYRGDARAAEAQLDSAAAVLAALGDVVAPVRVDLLGEQLHFLTWQRRWDAAAAAARALRAHARARADSALAAAADRAIARADSARAQAPAGRRGR